MDFVHISEIPWVPDGQRRPMAIFKNLLSSVDHLTAGVYINPVLVERGSPLDYLLPPKLLVLDSGSVAGKPFVVLQPVFRMLFSARPAVTRWNASQLAQRIQKTCLKAPSSFLWMNYAEYFSYHLSLQMAPGASVRIFDSADDYTLFDHLNPEEFKRQLYHLFSLSDTVVCVNEEVASRIQHPRKIVFRNCTEYSVLQQRNPSFALDGVAPKPAGAVYLGFIGGVVDRRIDWPLLERLLARFHFATFVFVGYCNSPALRQKLEAYSNVVFRSEVSFRDMGELIRLFDVAIIPHMDNEYTQGNDLLKVVDYLAVGVPVVSTSCSNIEQYQDVVYIAKSADDFEDYVNRLLLGNLAHNPDAGRQVARERSWSNRVPQLGRQLFKG